MSSSPDVTLRLGAGRVALRVRRRGLVVGLALLAVALGGLVASLTLGSYGVGPGAALEALVGRGDGATRYVVQELRLPRALCAVLVGAALGASGAVFQSLTRNPLGSPDVVGFTEGAAAAAVLTLLVLGGGTLLVAGGAVAGGMATALAVYALAWRRGMHGLRLVLVGVGIASCLASVTAYLVARADLAAAQGARVWLTGTLDGRGWEHVWPVALCLLLLAPALAALVPALRAMELGDDVARGLGLRLERARLALVLVGVALCAVATAAAGPIPFVALAAPQIARRLTRAPGTGVVGGALAGAALLTLADLGARTLFGGIELPVGVLTGALGGLYLGWLLARQWRAEGGA